MMSKLMFKCVEYPPSTDFAQLRAQNAARMRANAVERGLPSAIDRFLARVARLIDDVDAADVSGLAEFTFSFADGGQETFVLHRASNLSRAAGYDAPKRNHAETLVTLLQSAKISFSREAFSRLVNYTSARGATPLLVAPAFVGTLLHLGGDPVLALDGALYKAVKENTSRGVATLVESYLEHFQKEQMVRIVAHTRVDGVNAAAVAVMFADARLMRLVMQIGAPLDAELLVEMAELAGDAEILGLVKSLR
jgi:hypothetical protein